MFKICTRCGKRKKLTSFYRRAAVKSGFASMCRPCKKEYDRHYYNSKPQYRQKRKKAVKARLKKIHEFVCRYLEAHPCIDCGENDPVVLEFDHVRGVKRDTISKLKTISIDAVAREIQKCVVRCANCHRRRTAKQFKWRNKSPA